jgi:hypothetical protein
VQVKTTFNLLSRTLPIGVPWGALTGTCFGASCSRRGCDGTKDANRDEEAAAVLQATAVTCGETSLGRGARSIIRKLQDCIITRESIERESGGGSVAVQPCSFRRLTVSLSSRSPAQSLKACSLTSSHGQQVPL